MEAADTRNTLMAAEAEISRLNKAGKALCVEMNAIQVLPIKKSCLL